MIIDISIEAIDVGFLVTNRDGRHKRYFGTLGEAISYVHEKLDEAYEQQVVG